MCRVHSVERGGTGITTPSSRRRVDGMEDDATIQHERAVKFSFPHRELRRTALLSVSRTVAASAAGSARPRARMLANGWVRTWGRPVCKSKFYDAFVLTCQVDLHAIDATPA